MLATVRGMRTTVFVIAVLMFGGCASESSTESVVTQPEVTVSTTPRPDDATAADLEAQIAAIYPGVPKGKAADWSVAICRDILDGKDEATVSANTASRFAGGSRPNPSVEQAAAIVEVVKSSGFCA